MRKRLNDREKNIYSKFKSVRNRLLKAADIVNLLEIGLRKMRNIKLRDYFMSFLE